VSYPLNLFEMCSADFHDFLRYLMDARVPQIEKALFPPLIDGEDHGVSPNDAQFDAAWCGVAAVYASFEQ
jgi:hypothetical protein